MERTTVSTTSKLSRKEALYKTLYILALPLILITMALPFANILIGTAFMAECPAIPSLGAYLVSTGVIGSVCVVRWFTTALTLYTSMDVPEIGLYTAQALLLFTAIVTIAFTATNSQKDDTQDTSYCNSVILTYTYIMMAASLVVAFIFGLLAYINHELNPVQYWHELMRAPKRKDGPVPLKYRQETLQMRTLARKLVKPGRAKVRMTRKSKALIKKKEKVAILHNENAERGNSDTATSSHQ